MNTTADTGFLPDLDAVPADVWASLPAAVSLQPGNPVGSVMSLAYLQQALALAEQYDFIIASDECYADIYDDESQPPPSLLTAAAAMGNTQARRLHDLPFTVKTLNAFPDCAQAWWPVMPR